ncbi:lipoprotein, putative [Syntrophotalea carbinolica DSM 2380]|uniref:Lipoprotein, putative n=1 Tax=Syntrophotalea carbinolica (strain DSM 2380 / NBRC 103641 / GraBd1) TaxID=338963 RepID=Q3A125_SYNC1|nr:lipoprotein [Syntrophotalea carbinolica]ABA89932.1 lipoprotein, putative [Syntrophotalea carbinolica DSM 2380]
MRRLLWVVMLFVPVVLMGCSNGVYNVPKEQYRSMVKTLGVLPLMVDGGSEIHHPEARQVIDLLSRVNRGKEDSLVELLRQKKAYFDVRPVTGDPSALLRRIAVSRKAAGDEDGGYTYRFQPAAVAELARTTVSDALLVVVFNGAERQERRWDRTKINYLDAACDSILVSAAVVLPTGEVVWEYRSPLGEPFLNLQYPDFDEAHYNKSDQVALKYITLPGLERALTEPDEGWFGQTEVPVVYHQLFKELASGLKPGLLNPFSNGNAE